METLSVPEWGGEVYIRQMASRDRDAFEAEMANEQGRMVNFRARLAARCICDQAGKRIFTDADIEALGERSSVALGRIFDACTRLNSITATDADNAEKN